MHETQKCTRCLTRATCVPPGRAVARAMRPPRARQHRAASREPTCAMCEEAHLRQHVHADGGGDGRGDGRRSEGGGEEGGDEGCCRICRRRRSRRASYALRALTPLARLLQHNESRTGLWKHCSAVANPWLATAARRVVRPRQKSAGRKQWCGWHGSDAYARELRA